MGALLWKAVRTAKRLRPPVNYIMLGLGILVVATALASVRIPSECHPPLRLLPLFLSQAVLGLHDVAFRIPGLLAASVLAFLTHKVILMYQPRFFAQSILAGIFVLMIPTALHNALIVEPSFWTYFFGSLGILIFATAHFKNDASLYIWGSVVFGIGVLFRENTFIFWPAAAVFLWIKRRTLIKPWLLIIPVVFCVPFFYTVLHLGHPGVREGVISYGENKPGQIPAPTAAEPGFSAPAPSDETASQPLVTSKPLNALRPLINVYDSLVSLKGPTFILKSSDVFWVLLLVIGAGCALASKNPLALFYITLLTGYGLFHSIIPGFWPVGRYQGEYLASMTLLTIFLLSIRPAGLTSPWLVSLGVLSTHSYFFNKTLSHDLYFDNYFERRLSTEFYFPYKDALEFLHRQDMDGKFITIGASLTYGEALLWARGFTGKECNNYSQRQEAFTRFLSAYRGLDDFFMFLAEQDVSHFSVQFADKRDKVFRSSMNVEKLINDLNGLKAHGGNKPYSLQFTFHAPTGGAIDIYARDNQRY
jgi:hypothetical protein